MIGVNVWIYEISGGFSDCPLITEVQERSGLVMQILLSSIYLVTSLSPTKFGHFMKVTQILFALLGLLALLLFIRLWTGVGSFPEIWELEEQIAQQKKANEEQSQLNTQLRSDVTELGKNDEAIESHARSELGMIKKNETFYQVIMREDKPKPLTIAPEPGADRKAGE